MNTDWKWFLLVPASRLTAVREDRVWWEGRGLVVVVTRVVGVAGGGAEGGAAVVRQPGGGAEGVVSARQPREALAVQRQGEAVVTVHGACKQCSYCPLSRVLFMMTRAARLLAASGGWWWQVISLHDPS